MTSTQQPGSRLRAILSTPRPHEWALLLAALALTWRYFWLMDDAFIYFRYADNLLFLDRGLVMNAGEYVEGYSSPAWMLLVAAARSSQLDYWTLTRLSSLLFAGLHGVLLIALNHRMSPAGPRINLPLALYAGHYGMLTHFSSGLETPLVQLAAALLALAALRPDSRLLQLLLGALPLVRPDLGLPCALFVAYVWITTRRLPWFMLGSGLLLNGAWLGFRIYYYADILPNTFYLKAGREWSQGGWYIHNALWTHHYYTLTAAALLLYWKLRDGRPGHGPARLFMLVTSVASLTYVARIGGDMLYYRFTAFPLALLPVAAAGLPEAALQRLTTGAWKGWAAPAAALAVLAFSFSCYPYQLKGHPMVNNKTRHYHWISDAMWHRRHPQLRPNDNRADLDQRQLQRYAEARDKAPGKIPRIEVTGWCRRGFNAFDRHIIHELGLTDAVLSRIRMRPGRPGHKPLWDHAHLLAKAQKRALAKARKHARGARMPGMYRKGARGRRPIKWIIKNFEPIEAVERRIYNTHNLAHNLSLVTKPIGKIPP